MQKLIQKMGVLNPEAAPMIFPNEYTGDDSHDRQVFLAKVFNYAGIGPAVGNLARLDRGACRTPDRADAWLLDPEFKTLAEQAKKAGSMLQSIRALARKNSAPIDGSTLDSLRSKVEAGCTSPWKEHLLTTLDGYAPGPPELPNGESLPQLQPIWAMKVGSRWTIIIDESGSKFGRQSNDTPTEQRGCFVAVACNEHTKLTPLPTKYHATKSGTATTTGALLELASGNAGVLGLSADTESHTTSSDGWKYLLVQLLEWSVLALPLPVNDVPVSVTIKVEQHGPHAAGLDVRLIEQELLQLLQRRRESAASRASLKLSLVTKPGQPSIQHYADAAAYSWTAGYASQSEGKQAIVSETLKKLTVIPGALIRANHLPAHQDATAILVHHRLQSDQQLSQLLHLARESGPLSPAGYLLNHVAQHARINENARDELHRWVTDHVDDATVDLRTVQQELDWFESISLNEVLTASERLVLATAQLDFDNLCGMDECEEEVLIIELIEQLSRSHPLLCLQAELVLLSFWTNRFDFEPARERALDLAARSSSYSLLWQARVQSVLGQMHAFCNEWNESQSAFEKAMTMVSEYVALEPSYRDDALKIAILRAIASWDAPADTAFKPVPFTELLTLAQCPSLEMLIGAEDHHWAYLQHAFFRWMFGMSGSGAGSPVGASRDTWAVGTDHHPWQYIHLYRALLMRNADRKYAEDSFRRALDILSTWPDSSLRTLMLECAMAIGRALNFTIKRKHMKQAQMPADERPAWLHTRISFVRAWRLDPGDEVRSVQWLLRGALPYSMH